ncbi:MAG: DNA polymerase I, partial [candidate division Zixibacteria bacterium]|nr:DNA polymerase I [candidate division Zixibacteria bacterium]
MKKTLFLIDGSALVYRAYFALIRNPLITARGEPTSAVYGFINSLFRVQEEFHPTHILIVFDTKHPTFRHEMYPKYKSTRAKMPEDMAEQLPRLKELIDAMDIARIEQKGYEADDLIGTYAVRGEREGYDIVIVTGDKDFTQLVNDRIKMLTPVKSGEALELLDRDGVKGKMGVFPERVIDLLALMGDTSDNVPGIPGVGQKTALALLEKFETFEQVFKRGYDIPQKGLRKKVTEGKDSAFLSKDLVTIRTDIDIEFDPEKLAAKSWDNDRVREMFKELEFTRFLEKFGDDEETGQKPRPEFKQDYRLISSAGELKKLLDKAKKKGELTFDTETTGVNPITADLVGLSFSIEEGRAFYVPIAHDSYDD